MDAIRVHGDARLAGTVHVVGAKNSALKLMAAALLAPGRSVITNVPRITDIAIMGRCCAGWAATSSSTRTIRWTRWWRVAA
ncbi:hypothetical protein NKG94_43240 [Micromonospora sp. M12]